MILEKKIPLSYWFNLIKWDMLIVAFVIVGIHFLNLYLPLIKIPLSIGTFLGTAIALLLSFKLSQSYDRWWEARKIWGAIVNDSRSLVIQLKSFVISGDKERISIIANRQIAWCYALGRRLRGLDVLKNMESYISLNEIENIKDHSNIPLSLLDLHSEDITGLHQDKQINDFQQIQLNSTIVRLNDSMGMAERIKNTPFPKTYRRTLHFFIFIFLITLSFSLSDMRDIVELPLLMLISLPFFLLEKISQTIQDPFENKPSDTAMTAIARTIEVNIKEMIDEAVPPFIEKKESYFEL